MKEFLKYTLASCLGMVVAIIILSVIGFISIAGFVSFLSSSEEQVELPEEGILELKLDQIVPEKTNNAQVSPFSFSLEEQNVLGLQDMIRLIEHAKDDDKIKGIYINSTGATLANSTASDLRNAIENFKESDKFVFSYADNYTQGSYYLASVADSVYIHPTGSIDFRGFGMTIPFLKNTLEKLGIEAKVFYAGDFKSATEPLRRTDMSEENREQTHEYLRALYNIFLADIAESRNTTPEALEALADEFEIQFTEDAVNYGLVDRVVYEDQFRSSVRKNIYDDPDKEVNIISLNKYYVKNKKEIANITGEKEIAIIYFEGGIDISSADPGTIGSEKYVKLLRKIREKDDIAAVLLRINSGGGNALASDKIAREIQLIRDKGIPVVASMGNVAASGGYYIAAPADVIYASENTITGSIGVFAVIPQVEELMQDKIGLAFDTIGTGPYAYAFNLAEEFGETEKKYFQSMVDSIYQQFLEHVASSRSMPVEKVHEIAQGRVWPGVKAKEINLVDELGDFFDALDKTIGLADTEDYKIREYPKTKNPFEMILENLGNSGGDNPTLTKEIEKALSKNIPYYKLKKEYESLEGVQMRLPFYFETHKQSTVFPY
ncbi:MAG: signal peptide peptidase SppA [Bacteroidetes bacterium]|jgi:protease-4|nr:signal peptide peptidase SppA [Bacteroidota bacterium]